MSKLTDLLLADAYIGGGSGGGGGGEKWVEELLWENPNPNNTYGDSSAPTGLQTAVTTSDVWDALRVVWKSTTSADDKAREAIMFFYETGTSKNASIGMPGGSAQIRMASAYRAGGNIIVSFRNCAYNEYSTTKSNGNSIPLAIYGIKKG